eukprot:1160545-Pelagomonas_calceolata.AAC.12
MVCSGMAICGNRDSCASAGGGQKKFAKDQHLSAQNTEVQPPESTPSTEINKVTECIILRKKDMGVRTLDCSCCMSITPAQHGALYNKDG